MSKIVKNWKELSEVPNESKDYILKVDVAIGNGQLIPKDDDDDTKLYHYLSTHTFYNDGHRQYASKLLQDCGFDVELAEWEAAE